MGERVIEGFSNSDLRCCCKDNGVQRRTVVTLIRLGVDPEDVYDVLDMRNVLASYKPDGRIGGQISVKTIAWAYSRVCGDLDALELIVYRANSMANTWQAERRFVFPDASLKSQGASTRDFNIALNKSVRIFESKGIDGIE